jgi:hypothetical protein
VSTFLREYGPGDDLHPWLTRAQAYLIEMGCSEDTALSRAVAAARLFCNAGHLTSELPGEVGTRAEACAAVEKFEADRALAKAAR